MNNNEDKPPNSQLNLDNNGQVVKKWLTFILLSLLGIFGLALMARGIMSVPYYGIAGFLLGLLFSIPGATVCYLVYKCFRTIFSRQVDYDRQLHPIFCTSLVSVLILLLILAFIYIAATAIC